MFQGKSILVTGCTGSFGWRLVKEILDRYEPARLVVFSRDELKQVEMAAAFPHPAMRWFIGDVRDLDRLRQAMEGIDTVVHAAALKHVPVAEYNPMECIKTNINGAHNVITAAIAPNVPQRVVGIRPGEKLHEVMCPADDAHLTLEFDDHFVIRPSITFVREPDYTRNRLGEVGRPTPDGFVYESSSNPAKLSVDEIRRVLEDAADDSRASLRAGA